MKCRRIVLICTHCQMPALPLLVAIAYLVADTERNGEALLLLCTMGRQDQKGYGEGDCHLASEAHAKSMISS